MNPMQLFIPVKCASPFAAAMLPRITKCVIFSKDNIQKQHREYYTSHRSIYILVTLFTLIFYQGNWNSQKLSISRIACPQYFRREMGTGREYERQGFAFAPALDGLETNHWNIFAIRHGLKHRINTSPWLTSPNRAPDPNSCSRREGHFCAASFWPVLSAFS